MSCLLAVKVKDSFITVFSFITLSPSSLNSLIRKIQQVWSEKYNKSDRRNTVSPFLAIAHHTPPHITYVSPVIIQNQLSKFHYRHPFKKWMPIAQGKELHQLKKTFLGDKGSNFGENKKLNLMRLSRPLLVTCPILLHHGRLFACVPLAALLHLVVHLFRALPC